MSLKTMAKHLKVDVKLQDHLLKRPQSKLTLYMKTYNHGI